MRLSFNASKFASGLSINAPTVTSYIDLFVDLLLIRRLRPFHGNPRKRLFKSPKIYVRDSGLVGASSEGFVIENLLSVAPPLTKTSFYRTSAGAEIDLVLEPSGERGLWAIEIKYGLRPNLSKGFHHARADLRPKRTFIVYSGSEPYPITAEIEAIGLREMAATLAELT